MEPTAAERELYPGRIGCNDSPPPTTQPTHRSERRTDSQPAPPTPEDPGIRERREQERQQAEIAARRLAAGTAFNQGVYASQLADWRSAIAAFERALHFAPGDRAILARLTSARNRLQDAREAERIRAAGIQLRLELQAARDLAQANNAADAAAAERAREIAADLRDTIAASRQVIYAMAICAHATDASSDCVGAGVGEATDQLTEMMAEQVAEGISQRRLEIFVPPRLINRAEQIKLLFQIESAAIQAIELKLNADIRRLTPFRNGTPAQEADRKAVAAAMTAQVQRWNRDARAQARSRRSWSEKPATNSWHFRSGAYDQLRQIDLSGW